MTPYYARKYLFLVYFPENSLVLNRAKNYEGPAGFTMSRPRSEHARKRKARGNDE